ncbi:hypothetical protein [Kitasatospora indigofera]|uniref:hypothetical protein n=1 Tax=Kitasatospora indigofera TaxID=67307 RepID=UPI0033AEB796
MDAADLDYRARTLSGCIPPLTVSRLLELGHAEEVEFQAGRGEWFCAREWARLLGDQGQQAQALEVLAPYVATGWWPAARDQVKLLEGWERVEEAIELSRPYAEAGDRIALEFFARLLARYDRSGEAFELLSAGIEDWFLAAAMVDVSEAAGRDEDAAVLLTAQIPADTDATPRGAADVASTPTQRSACLPRSANAKAVSTRPSPCCTPGTAPPSTAAISWPTCSRGTTGSRNCAPTWYPSTTGTLHSASPRPWRSAVTWKARSLCTGNRATRRAANSTARCNWHSS